MKKKINIHLSCHKHLMKEKNIAGSKLKFLAATYQRALVQVHFSCLDQVEENQSNKIAKKEISHQHALLQGYFSCLDQAEENQSEIKYMKGNCRKRKFIYFTQQIRFHSDMNGCA